MTLKESELRLHPVFVNRIGPNLSLQANNKHGTCSTVATMPSGIFCWSRSLAMDRGLTAAAVLTAILVMAPMSSAAPPGMQWFPGPTTIFRGPMQQAVPPMPVMTQMMPQPVPLMTPPVAPCVSVEPCIAKVVCSPTPKCKCKNKCKCKSPCQCNAEDERIEALEQFLERASDFYFTPILDEPIHKSSCCGCKRPKTCCCSEEDENDRPSTPAPPRSRDSPPGRSGRNPDRGRSRGGGGGGTGRDIQGDMPPGRSGSGRNRDRNQDRDREDDMEDSPPPRRGGCKGKDCGCKPKDCGCKPKKSNCCCLPEIEYDCYY